jgi:hypothetical protein
LFAQNDTAGLRKRERNRYVAWLLPSAAKNIYGIALGPIGSEAICNLNYTRYSHGINIQIPGQGFFQTFYIKKIKFKDLGGKDNEMGFYTNDTVPKRAVHNGIVVSLTGTFTDCINGISVSPWMSMGKDVNGVSFNLLWNVYYKINGVSVGFVNFSVETKGVQIGLVNKTKRLRGIQVGLWNKNEKRSLPLINWNFK